MAARPLLYLDVDGVLNCPNPTVPAARHDLDPDSWRTAADRARRARMTARPQFAGSGGAPDGRVRIPVWVPEGTAERITAISCVYDVVWATAWRRTAHPAFKALLGLPDEPWPALEWDDYKLPAIVEHAAGRPWAFVDDDITFELDGTGLAERIPGDHLLIECDPSAGLTDTHVAQLLEFAGGA
jgi:hypothetical protein